MSSRLLENAFKNRSMQNLNEIDMSKSGNAMMRHLGVGFPYGVEDSVPIEPEVASWAQIQLRDKICMQKIFNLESQKHLSYFINELLHTANQLNHHPEILINHTQVTVTLYTRDLNDITDIDIEISKKIDDIIEDINVIKFRG